MTGAPIVAYRETYIQISSRMEVFQFIIKLQHFRNVPHYLVEQKLNDKSCFITQMWNNCRGISFQFQRVINVFRLKRQISLVR